MMSCVFASDIRRMQCFIVTHAHVSGVGGASILGGIAAELWEPLGQNFVPSAAVRQIEAMLVLFCPIQWVLLYIAHFFFGGGQQHGSGDTYVVADRS